MEARFDLVTVAFVEAADGSIRLLLAVDREGQQLFDGTPVLLVEHAPGMPAECMKLEGADGIDEDVLGDLHAQLHAPIAELLESCLDAGGKVAGERLLGASVAYVAARRSFDM